MSKRNVDTGVQPHKSRHASKSGRKSSKATPRPVHTALLKKISPAGRALVLIGWTEVLLAKHGRVNENNKPVLKRLETLSQVLKFSRELAELSTGPHAARVAFADTGPAVVDKWLTRGARDGLSEDDHLDVVVFHALESAWNLPGPNREQLDGASFGEDRDNIKLIGVAMRNVSELITHVVATQPYAEWANLFKAQSIHRFPCERSAIASLCGRTMWEQVKARPAHA